MDFVKASETGLEDLEDKYLIGKLYKRFIVNQHGRFYVFFILALIAWTIARHTILSWFYRVLSCFCKCICKKEKDYLANEDPSDTEEVVSKDIYKDMSLYFL